MKQKLAVHKKQAVLCTLKSYGHWKFLHNATIKNFCRDQTTVDIVSCSRPTYSTDKRVVISIIIFNAFSHLLFFAVFTFSSFIKIFQSNALFNFEFERSNRRCCTNKAIFLQFVSHGRCKICSFQGMLPTRERFVQLVFQKKLRDKLQRTD